jgi:DNA-binding NarL/FixJ family response regulator
VVAGPETGEHCRHGRPGVDRDDHAGFGTLARMVLTADGFDVVGEAADATAAIRAARELRPDVVLLDVQLPDRDGFGVADALAGPPPAPAVVLISSRSRSDYRRRVLAGAADTS